MSDDRRVFLLSCVFLVLFTGLMIPSTVLVVSAMEFMDVKDLQNPAYLLVSPFLTATGLLLLWGCVFYLLSSIGAQKKLALVMWLVSAVAFVDFMLFGKGFGIMSRELVFDSQPVVDMKTGLINLAVIAIFGVLACIGFKKKTAVIVKILVFAIIAVTLMSGFFVCEISAQYRAALKSAKEESENKQDITLKLSRTGRNVVVIMLDRAMSSLLPYLMNERPELNKMLDGMTWYPNTVSFGSHTSTGNIPLYGGYEYIPEEINKRTDETMTEKQNEALRVMPVIFDNEGFDVTVCDPTYAGYQVIPDLGIYADHPGISTYITMGNITDSKDYVEDIDEKRKTDNRLKRNLFVYGIFKCAPSFLQPLIYDDGDYCGVHSLYTDEKVDMEHINDPDNISKSGKADRIFRQSYNVLDALPELTAIDDDDKGCFLMMSNDITHSLTLLKEPEYLPRDWVDNTDYDRKNEVRYSPVGGELRLDTRIKMEHYHVNMAALIQLGEWFDYLRAQGVYDNTRIIVTSDHSINLAAGAQINVDGVNYESGREESLDVEQFNCMLLVKDFGKQGFEKSEVFMTNADVPAMAMEGVISDPVNPFTGKKIGTEYKDRAKLLLLDTYPDTQGSDRSFGKGAWFSVHDNIFDKDNWSFEGIR